MISEHLSHSTVRITSIFKNNMIATGTGFFFIFHIENDDVPVIVTNKHVVRNSIKGTFRLSVADNNGNRIKNDFIDINCQDFEEMWIMHPDENIDLCIMPIAVLFEEAQKMRKTLYFKGLDRSIIPSPQQIEKLTAIEDILMIGYPNGLWDSYNNMPIIRRGVTATNVKLDYNNKKEFLIDIAAFPGSSGSPVFIYNQGTYPISDGIAVGNRLILLGVLYAGTQMGIKGDLEIKEIPTYSMPMVISQIPNNIGVVIKIEKLLDFEHILKEKMIDFGKENIG